MLMLMLAKVPLKTYLDTQCTKSLGHDDTWVPRALRNLATQPLKALGYSRYFIWQAPSLVNDDSNQQKERKKQAELLNEQCFHYQQKNQSRNQSNVQPFHLLKLHFGRPTFYRFLIYSLIYSFLNLLKRTEKVPIILKDSSF